MKMQPSVEPEVGEIGRLLFGRALRAELALWILGLRQDRFFLAEAMEAQPSKNRSGVGQELERFVEAGLLVEEPRGSGDRRRYFVRSKSRLWDIFRAVQRASNAADTS